MFVYVHRYINKFLFKTYKLQSCDETYLIIQYILSNFALGFAVVGSDSVVLKYHYQYH